MHRSRSHSKKLQESDDNNNNNDNDDNLAAADNVGSGGGFFSSSSLIHHHAHQIPAYPSGDVAMVVIAAPPSTSSTGNVSSEGADSQQHYLSPNLSGDFGGPGGDFIRVESSPQSSIMDRSYDRNNNPFGPLPIAPPSNSAPDGPLESKYGGAEKMQFISGGGGGGGLLPPLMDVSAINSPDISQLSINTPTYDSARPNLPTLNEHNSSKSSLANYKKGGPPTTNSPITGGDSKENQHMSFSKSETKEDSSGEVISSGSVGSPPEKISASDRNGAPAGGWYRDDFRVRGFDEADNEEVKELEKTCLRGGVEIGAFLKTRSMSDKGGLFAKAHLVVQIKSQAPPPGGNGAPVSSKKSKGFSSNKKSKAQVGDEVCGFGCGAIERFLLDGTFHYMGLVVDLFVHPQFRRRNLASRIFQELEGKMRRVGVTMIIMRIPRSNDAGLHFIRKHGFSEMLDMRIIGWKCESRVPTPSLVDQITDTVEASKLLQDKFDQNQLFVEPKMLNKVLLHDQFHGGTFVSASEETKSEAQVTIFKYHELYRVKMKPSHPFLAGCFACFSSNDAGADLNSMCILYCARYSGPEGPFLMRQVLAEAHNKCLTMGASFVGMVFTPNLQQSPESALSGSGAGAAAAAAGGGGSGGKPGLDPEDIVPCDISLDTEFVLLGKPISEALPKLKGKSVFIDPRW